MSSRTMEIGFSITLNESIHTVSRVRDFEKQLRNIVGCEGDVDMLIDTFGEETGEDINQFVYTISLETESRQNLLEMVAKLYDLKETVESK